MEIEPKKNNGDNKNQPYNPEKHLPAKPDRDSDPLKTRPGVNEPSKIDPTRIDEPENPDPKRTDPASALRPHKWTRVSNWNDVLKKMEGAGKH